MHSMPQHRARPLVGLFAGLIALLPVVAAAADVRSSAPYFEAYAAGEKVESLPLAATDVDVVIGGVLADVTVKQVYENRGTVPVEAVYVFPASSRASVYAVTMTVGDRVIRAKLREKDDARREYEEARSEGRTASLLEQQDVGAFRMNVANVLPGDSIQVEMRYAELLVPTKGVYEFFFPTTAPMEKYGETGATAMASSSSDAVVKDAFGMTVRLVSGAPIAQITSDTHPLQVSQARPDEATVTISPDDRRAGAKDFVLRYSMLGDDVGTGVLAFRGSEENFFLLTAQPPKAVRPAMIPPREYIFVVDVSGSMTGRPLDVSRALVADLFSQLRPEDRFNVVLFAGDSQVMSERGSPHATKDTLADALDILTDVEASGGTELGEALDTAYALPATPGMARTVLIITDGAIAAGGDVATKISSRLDEANAFVFGIGDYLDRAVIDRLARAGEGEPFVAETMDAAEAQAKRLREYIDRPVLTQAKLRWSGGADLYDLEPPAIPDLFAERPIVVVGKYRGELKGEATIEGWSGGGPVKLVVDLDEAYEDPSLSSLPRLWARRRIDRVTDAGECSRWGSDCDTDAEALKAEVTALGLRYGVLTPHTSFVAVTDDVRTDVDATTVFQPVPARDVATLASAPPPPPPAASGFGGYGFDPTVALQVAAAPAVLSAPSLDAARPLRELAGHRMQATADGWRDLAHVDGVRVLRIRRDSAAFAALLALRPELAPLFALDGRVLVSLGAGWSVQITPDGFGDYPEATLRAAALGTR